MGNVNTFLRMNNISVSLLIFICYMCICTTMAEEENIVHDLLRVKGVIKRPIS